MMTMILVMVMMVIMIMKMKMKMKMIIKIIMIMTRKRLSWYGHIMRREETHITRSTLSMTVTGTRPRGRPKMRWLDILKSDMRIFGITREMATDRERWAVMVKNVDTT